MGAFRIAFRKNSRSSGYGILLLGIVVNLGTGTFFVFSTDLNRGGAIDYECTEGYGRLAIRKLTRVRDYVPVK